MKRSILILLMLFPCIKSFAQQAGLHPLSLWQWGEESVLNELTYDNNPQIHTIYDYHGSPWTDHKTPPGTDRVSGPANFSNEHTYQTIAADIDSKLIWGLDRMENITITPKENNTRILLHCYYPGGYKTDMNKPAIGHHFLIPDIGFDTLKKAVIHSRSTHVSFTDNLAKTGEVQSNMHLDITQKLSYPDALQNTSAMRMWCFQEELIGGKKTLRPRHCDEVIAITQDDPRGPGDDGEVTCDGSTIDCAEALRACKRWHCEPGHALICQQNNPDCVEDCPPDRDNCMVDICPIGAFACKATDEPLPCDGRVFSHDKGPVYYESEHLGQVKHVTIRPDRLDDKCLILRKKSTIPDNIALEIAQGPPPVAAERYWAQAGITVELIDAEDRCVEVRDNNPAGGSIKHCLKRYESEFTVHCYRASGNDLAAASQEVDCTTVLEVDLLRCSRPEACKPTLIDSPIGHWKDEDYLPESIVINPLNLDSEQCVCISRADGIDTNYTKILDENGKELLDTSGKKAGQKGSKETTGGWFGAADGLTQLVIHAPQNGKVTITDNSRTPHKEVSIPCTASKCSKIQVLCHDGTNYVDCSKNAWESVSRECTARAAAQSCTQDNPPCARSCSICNDLCVDEACK